MLGSSGDSLVDEELQSGDFPPVRMRFRSMVKQTTGNFASRPIPERAVRLVIASCICT